MTTGYFLGIDIGGTFTDLVLGSEDGSRLEAVKRLTTPQDPAVAVIDGVTALLRLAGVKPAQVHRVVHATTLATNLILERRGAAVAYLATEGFGEIPRIGREMRVGAERYDLFFEKPVAPVDDQLIFEVPERIDAAGRIVRPLDEAAAEEVALRIAAREPGAVAVCLLHSYANPVHERRLAQILGRVMPETHLALSSEVWPEYREYDRALTTIMSAYVGPVMAGYVDKLAGALAALGIPAPLQIMQSNGGILPAHAAVERAVYSVESGPAAGVVAAGAIGRRIDRPNVISFDMGGTTAKAGLIRDGQPIITHEFHVGGQVSIGSRKSGGFPVRIPVIDLAEVGAGGGSIAWVDPGGILQVGPRSAGADPGPACYGFGGESPTVTDADLVLGYLDPADFLDGQMTISIERARTAIARAVADPLGLTLVAAAHGIYEIANANMAAAIRVVTVQRGIDPRAFLVVAFGGAGPVHIVRVAEEFEIPQVVIPIRAGVMSAIGLLTSDIAVDSVRTRVTPTDEADPATVTAIFRDLEATGRRDLITQGVPAEDIVATRSVDVRFKYQSHELTVPLPAGDLAPDRLAEVSESFYAAYLDQYGIDRRDPTELVNYRVRLTGTVPKVQFARSPTRPGNAAAARRGTRPAYFPEAGGFVETAIFNRDRLVSGDHFTGPAIVQEPDATVVIPPAYRVTVDEYANLVISRPGS